MIGARYFASTSREIRTHSGSCSRCGKLGPILRPIDFCRSTVTRNLAMTWCRSRERWGSPPLRTAFRSPWQNGVAERWVGGCRRDLLDHVIVLNERHLKRLMATSATTTTTGRIWGLLKTLPLVGRLCHAFHPAGTFDP